MLRWLHAQGHLRYLYMRFDKPARIPSASTPEFPMALSTRRIALVCMTPASDANEHGDMELPSYGIRRHPGCVDGRCALQRLAGCADRRREAGHRGLCRSDRQFRT